MVGGYFYIANGMFQPLPDGVTEVTVELGDLLTQSLEHRAGEQIEQSILHRRIIGGGVEIHQLTSGGIEITLCQLAV